MTRASIGPSPGAAALCLVAAALAGCGGDAGAAGSLVVTDSAGIRMVDTPAPHETPTGIRVSDEPVYRVGWESGDPAFETLTTGALFEDGRAVVVNGGQTQQLVLLDPSGAVETTLGAPGGGPGEFTAISSIVTAPGDTILVHDPRAGRISKFTPAGFVGSLRAEEASLLHLHGLDEDSGGLLLGMPLAMVMGRRYDTPFLGVPHVQLDWDSRSIDTLVVADWDQSIAEGGGNNPFMSGGFSTVSQGQLVVGRGDRPELRWIDAQGRLQQVVRWPAQTEEVPDPLLEEFETRTRTRFEEFGLPSADIESRITSMKDAIQEPLPVFGLPGSMPPAGGLVGDPDGNVWIAEYRAPGHGPPLRYRVMNPEGAWLATVEMPPGARVLDIGRDHLLAVERDEFDVEAAVLYRLER